MLPMATRGSAKDDGVAPWTLVVCVLLLQGVLPLTPLGVEWLRHGRVSDFALIVTAPLYLLSLGASCRHPLSFTLGIVSGFFTLGMFGTGLDVGDPVKFTLEVATRRMLLAAGLVICAAFAHDRWDVHARRFEPLGMWRPRRG